MLGKALKYDLKSIYKLWLLLSGIILGMSVIAGLSLRSLIYVDNPAQHFEAWEFLPVIFLLVSFLALFAYIVFTYFYPIYRFYKHFFTDEGYLTFTLPVKRSTHLNSKILNAFIWNTASGVVITLALLIVFLIAPAKNDGTGIFLVKMWEVLAPAIQSFIKIASGWEWALIIVLLLISCTYSLFSTLLIFACVTFGSVIAKKHKVVLSIVVYYVVNMVISFIAFIFTTLFSLADSALMTLAGVISIDAYNLITLFTLACCALFFVAVSVFTYNFTLSQIEKRLNLA